MYIHLDGAGTNIIPSSLSVYIYRVTLFPATLNPRRMCTATTRLGCPLEKWQDKKDDAGGEYIIRNYLYESQR